MVNVETFHFQTMEHRARKFQEIQATTQPTEGHLPHLSGRVLHACSHANAERIRTTVSSVFSMHS